MIRLQYGRMLEDGLDGGIDGERGLSRARLGELARRFPAVQGEIRSRTAEGGYGYLALTDQEVSGV